MAMASRWSPCSCRSGLPCGLLRTADKGRPPAAAIGDRRPCSAAAASFDDEHWRSGPAIRVRRFLSLWWGAANCGEARGSGVRVRRFLAWNRCGGYIFHTHADSIVCFHTHRHAHARARAHTHTHTHSVSRLKDFSRHIQKNVEKFRRRRPADI